MNYNLPKHEQALRESSSDIIDMVIEKIDSCGKISRNKLQLEIDFKILELIYEHGKSFKIKP